MYSYNREEAQTKRATRIRERFQSDYLPRFGGLWRGMAVPQPPPSKSEAKPPLNFVEAIERKTSVQIQVQHTMDDGNCGCEGCAPPVEDFEADSDQENQIHPSGGVEKAEYQWRERDQDSGETLSEEDDDDEDSLNTEDRDFIDDEDDNIDDGESHSSHEHAASTPLPSELTTEFGNMFSFTPVRDQPKAEHDEGAAKACAGQIEQTSEQGSSTGTSGSEFVSFDVSHFMSSPAVKTVTNDNDPMFSEQLPPQFSPQPKDQEPQNHLKTTAAAAQDDDDSSSVNSGYEVDLSYLAHSPPTKYVAFQAGEGGRSLVAGADSVRTPLADEFKAREFEPASFPLKGNGGVTSVVVKKKDAGGTIGTNSAPSSSHQVSNESVLIDLIDSDEENVEPIWSQPPRSTRKHRVLVDSSDESSIVENRKPNPRFKKGLRIRDDDDESSEDHEWNGSLSSGPSFASPDDDDSENDMVFAGRKSISKLAKGNRHAVDLIDVENKYPNKEHLSKRSGKSMSTAAFKKSRDDLSRQYFAEYNRNAFDGQLADVKVVWSNKLLTTAGLTRLSKKQEDFTPGAPPVRHATVELSTKVLDDTERLQSTLLHEMCHAAAWKIDGISRPAHGPCFKKWARHAMRQIPGSEVTTTHDYKIQYKYAWACVNPGCTFLVQRHSRSVDIVKHRCGRCRGKLIEVEALNPSSKSDVQRTPKKRAPPSAYNQFVKEQSKGVRERLAKKNQKVSQAEVMKECARLWRERKEAPQSARE